LAWILQICGHVVGLARRSPSPFQGSVGPPPVG
jgi:hypothetical protein